MPDKKLTDSEIVKALKEVLELMLCDGFAQQASTVRDALDLINRLQAENKRLKKEIENLESTQEISPEAKHFVDTKADKVISLLNEVIKSQEQIKAEAYKECIEKVKKDKEILLFGDSGNHYRITDKQLDNLLKELGGDKQ